MPVIDAPGGQQAPSAQITTHGPALRWRVACLVCVARSIAWAAATVYLEYANAAEGDVWFSTKNIRSYASVISHTLYTTSTRNLDDQSNLVAEALHGKLQYPFIDAVELRFDGRVGLSNADNSSTGMNRILEGYLLMRTDNGKTNLGKQIYAWGRADSINPTDNLSPRDYTTLLPFADDEHFGVPAARLDCHWPGVGAWSVYATPLFTPTKIPIALPVGIPLGEKIPGISFANTTWAAKYDSTGGLIDWSVSAFQGHSLLPVLVPSIGQGGGFVVDKTYPRIRSFGADAVYPWGKNGLRAEVAYIEPIGREGQGDVFSPYVFSVLGYERTLPMASNITAQVIYRHALGNSFTDFTYANANANLNNLAIQNAITFGQLHNNTFGLSARVSKLWLNDTLETEVLSVSFFNPDNYFFRLRSSYSINDNAAVTIGLEGFVGQEQSFFGRVEKNNRFYFELRYAL